MDLRTTRRIGVIHLPRLDATPLDALLERTRSDATKYADAGFDALLVENFGDSPFPKNRSPPHVPAVLARCVAEAITSSGRPVGCNVLRNDALAAVAACHAGGGSFVRINILTGAALTDQGLIEGEADRVYQYREALGTDLKIFADIHVKHATPLVPRSIADDAEDTWTRAGADALLVTGSGTGKAAALDDAQAIRERVPDAPVYVASGVTPDNIADALRVAQGVIIGTSAKVGAVTVAPVDAERAHALVAKT